MEENPGSRIKAENLFFEISGLRVARVSRLRSQLLPPALAVPELSPTRSAATSGNFLCQSVPRSSACPSETPAKIPPCLSSGEKSDPGRVNQRQARPARPELTRR